MNKLMTIFHESKEALFLIPAGIILVIFGFIFFFSSKKNSNFIKTEAIVSKTELVEEAHTDGEGNYQEAIYKVYVKYNVDDKEYEEELGELSNYKKGDKLTIYYNPDKPAEITQSISIVIPIILMVAGAVATIGGLVSGVNTIKKLNE